VHPEDDQQHKARCAQRIRVEVQGSRYGVQRKRDKGERHDTKPAAIKAGRAPERRPTDAPSRIGSTGGVQGATIVSIPAKSASRRSGIAVKVSFSLATDVTS
jgi:hypothetical protein